MEHLGSILLAFAEWKEVIPDLNFIGKLIQVLYNWLGNYGLTVVVFTLFLKILTLPLELWQKVVMRKDVLKRARLAPMIEKIDRAYAHDQNRANQEKQKLYKKEQYSALSACLPMLVTLGVFIIMLSGLSNYANYINIKNYADLDAHYSAVYQETRAAALSSGKTDDEASAEAIAAGKAAVGLYYSENIQESFLWVKNVWRPDTWEKAMATAQQFQNGNIAAKGIPQEAPFDAYRYQAIYEGVLEANPGYFAKIENGALISSGWNGLLILPILTLVLSVLSSIVTARQQRASGTANAASTSQQESTQKMMTFIMPAIMGVFALFYTAAFAVYLVCNSLLTLALTFGTTGLVNAWADKSAQKKQPPKATYKR